MEKVLQQNPYWELGEKGSGNGTSLMQDWITLF